MISESLPFQRVWLRDVGDFGDKLELMIVYEALYGYPPFASTSVSPSPSL